MGMVENVKKKSHSSDKNAIPKNILFDIFRIYCRFSAFLISFIYEKNRRIHFLKFQQKKIVFMSSCLRHRLFVSTNNKKIHVNISIT